MNELTYKGRSATRMVLLGYILYNFTDMWIGSYTHTISIWYYGGYYCTRTNNSHVGDGSYTINGKLFDRFGCKI